MKETNWREPDRETKYICSDGLVRTWADLVDGLRSCDYPKDGKDEELLLWAFGAKKS